MFHRPNKAADTVSASSALKDTNTQEESVMKSPASFLSTQTKVNASEDDAVSSSTKEESKDMGDQDNTAAKVEAEKETQGQPNVAAASARPAGFAAGGTSYNAGSSFGSTTSTSSSYDRDTGRKLVVGQGINMSGEIDSCDHLIVEGTVEAALKGAAILDIYEQGTFFGTVEIQEATISGKFEGDLVVHGRLTLRSSAEVSGTIAYGELAVEAGAQMQGTIRPTSALAAEVATPVKKKTAKKLKAANNVEAEADTQLPFASDAATA